MKKNRRIIAVVCATVLLLSGAAIALASEENELEFCDHSYTVTAFSDGVATLTCSECGDTITDRFVDHINERDYEALDLNSDGIVNAKDYARLIKEY